MADFLQGSRCIECPNRPAMDQDQRRAAGYNQAAGGAALVEDRSSGQGVISIKFGAKPIEFEGQSRHRGPVQGQAPDR